MVLLVCYSKACVVHTVGIGRPTMSSNHHYTERLRDMWGYADILPQFEGRVEEILHSQSTEHRQKVAELGIVP